MAPLRIAYVTTPIHFGGAEKVSLNFLKTVDRTRFQINPIAFVRPWESSNLFVQELERENYSVSKVPVAVRPASEGKDYLRILRCFRIMLSLLRNNDLDMVHTHGYFADIVGIPVAKMLGIPVVSTCHGFISTDRQLRLYNFLDTLALRLCNRVIAVSENLRTMLVDKKIQESRVEVVLNAVDAGVDADDVTKVRARRRAALNINHEEFVIGYVGRLSPEKGVSDLLAAMRHIDDQIPGVRLLIMGEGSEKEQLEGLVKDWGLGHIVTFTGFQSDMNQWMPMLDLFVLPSYTEGTPMALLEAMALGICCLASAVGGVPKIIQSGENGLLVSPGNPSELKEAIVYSYKNDERRQQFAQASIRTINATYSLRQWTRKIEAIYHSVVQ